MEPGNEEGTSFIARPGRVSKSNGIVGLIERELTMPRVIVSLLLTILLSVYATEVARSVRIHDPDLVTSPESLELVIKETKQITLTLNKSITDTLLITFKPKPYYTLSQESFNISSANNVMHLNVTGDFVASKTFVELASCKTQNGEDCPVNATKVFTSVTIMYSYVMKFLIMATGWIYFVAWSVSFYPQIWLNFRRKSVEGLNFDFLYLNIIGFTCYSIYNVFMFFDEEVQELYELEKPRSVIPVFPNDVVFALHALVACIITGLQCFIYERGQQRISYICWGWSSTLIAISLGCLGASLFKAINWLQFINYLSYIKLAVTASKYLPQAILNFKRKSTVGWSIGNILLDFTGGSMDILQMILQAVNTDDWSGFTGNKVKFGLGIVSMGFDVLFIIQHYCLYRHTESFDLKPTKPSVVTVNTVEVIA
ncbi:unnamed protein product [Bursaphelenchus okinawaensis]|uniref:Cystinosin homolog n=1 Tax=Bursaphelenchus okinawaensis TaxID=465554 RepID=A0A811K9G3_9BILA|nr:unnamed protein product [Bursaphelenchus okinawaensis]CAG9094727.1 unnamed protein product [Bursaphelenchus okinawaensis]